MLLLPNPSQQSHSTSRHLEQRKALSLSLSHTPAHARTQAHTCTLPVCTLRKIHSKSKNVLVQGLLHKQGWHSSSSTSSGDVSFSLFFFNFFLNVFKHIFPGNFSFNFSLIALCLQKPVFKVEKPKDSEEVSVTK